MSHDLIFYTNPRSRGAIIRWMLEEIGCEYETKALNFGPEMKSEHYLKLNPMGKVPTICHNGKVVTECAAICAYLADAFPEKGLGPKPDQRAAYYRWMFFAAGPLEAAIANKALGVEVPEKLRGVVGYGNFDLTINALVTAVSQSPYIAGDTFTAADVYVGSQIGWGLGFKTIPERQEFVSYWDRINKRPAYISAKQKDEGLM